MLRTIPITAIIVFLPGLAAAAQPPCDTQTPAYPFDYSRVASQLLEQTRQDARQVANDVRILRTEATDPSFLWGNDADRVNRIRSKVDEMGRDVCRLRSIQSVADRWEQRTISKIAPQVQYMADNTGDALTYLRNHDDGIWIAQFRKYTRNLNAEAKTVSSTIQQAETRAQVRADDTQIGADEGLWRK